MLLTDVQASIFNIFLLSVTYLTRRYFKVFLSETGVKDTVYAELSTDWVSWVKAPMLEGVQSEIFEINASSFSQFNSEAQTVVSYSESESVICFLTFRPDFLVESATDFTKAIPSKRVQSATLTDSRPEQEASKHARSRPGRLLMTQTSNLIPWARGTTEP